MSDKPLDEVYIIRELEQVKLLADPLRLRLLESFCREEKTTKQVANELDEKPTRLYHHVEALERVGLIRLARTQQNRGTVEKYYRAVAMSFRAEPGLFSSTLGGEAKETDVLTDLSTTLFDRTAREFREASQHADAQPATLEEEGLITMAEVHASTERIIRLRDRLMEVLQEVSSEDEADDADEKHQRRFRLAIILFPLDLGERKPE